MASVANLTEFVSAFDGPEDKPLLALRRVNTPGKPFEDPSQAVAGVGWRPEARGKNATFTLKVAGISVGVNCLILLALTLVLVFASGKSNGFGP